MSNYCFFLFSYSADIPTSNQLVPLFRDSSNCGIARLSPAQASNPNVSNMGDVNGRFEAIACDPVNGKMYVGNEESPMIVWALDFASGIVSVLIDVQQLPDWTARKTEIFRHGERSDWPDALRPLITRKVAIQSTFNGTVIDSPLDVSMLNDPGSLSFEPTTGETAIFGAPPIIAIPTKAPSKSPTKEPTKFPTKTPTKQPTKAPTNLQAKLLLPPRCQ